jgi:hypothetical protein
MRPTWHEQTEIEIKTSKRRRFIISVNLDVKVKKSWNSQDYCNVLYELVL